MGDPASVELEQYFGLARKLAGRFRLRGYEPEDVYQEALLALVIAGRDYRPERGSFGKFATLVIERHLIECLRRQQRKVELVYLPEWAEPEAPDPIRGRLELIEFRRRFATLTELELEAVRGRLAGLETTRTKQNKNALIRARRKLA